VPRSRTSFTLERNRLSWRFVDFHQFYGLRKFWTQFAGRHRMRSMWQAVVCSHINRTKLLRIIETVYSSYFFVKRLCLTTCRFFHKLPSNQVYAGLCCMVFYKDPHTIAWFVVQAVPSAITLAYRALHRLCTAATSQ